MVGTVPQKRKRLLVGTVPEKRKMLLVGPVPEKKSSEEVIGRNSPTKKGRGYW